MAGDSDAITLIAVADVEVNSDDPDGQFDLVRDLLQGGDITFGQLEIPLANTVNPGALVGGPYQGANSGPEKDARKGAKVLERAGFDVMSFAGNHIMDRGAEPLLDTLTAVAEETHIKLIGAGMSIEDTRRPAIFDVRGTKVGFLAYCSVLRANAWASARLGPNGDLITRAGCAPLRAHTYHEDVDYQPGNRARIVTETYPEDLAAMLADIEKLRPQVDVLVVSYHWGVHFDADRGTIAMYQVEAGHAAIDAGADLILGHHPHTIKGIEYYAGKPILYGMPNFNLGVRDRNEEPYPLWVTADSEKSFIAKFVIEQKAITSVAFLPCHLDYTTRQPEPLQQSDRRSQDIMSYTRFVCAHNAPTFWSGTGAQRAIVPFDTEFAYNGDWIVVSPAHS